ncbi:MAG: protease modulator HflC [Pseudolabrys sp.]
MNVIDVTPRPASVTAAVRFLQSPVMSILGILFILTALKWGTLLFVVPQYETVIITRFGKIVRTITTPGLKMKLPVIDKLQRFDKRILAWDGPPIECPTKDKLYIIVDCFARWRISDPMLYYNRLNDERSALSRLDDILGSETRTAVATHDLVEIIRVTKGRKPVRDEELEKTGTVLPTTIPDIEYGRGEIEKQITERTRQKIADFGIELLDERFKRIFSLTGCLRTAGWIGRCSTPLPKSSAISCWWLAFSLFWRTLVSILPHWRFLLARLESVSDSACKISPVISSAV